MRRIIKYCEELNNFASWDGPHTDVWNGEYIFSAKPCNKELGVIAEQIFEEDSEFIPLLRDKHGRITPVGNKLELRECGHWTYSTVELDSDGSEMPRRGRHKTLWKKLEKFQKTAIEQLEENNLSGYCSYDTGVGKTVISLSLLRENFNEMTPCLIITEAGDISRWQKEAIKWLGGGELMRDGDLTAGMGRIPQIVTKHNSHHSITPVVITSWTNISDPKFQKWLFEQGFKSVISDESHMFKDEGSKRTQGLVAALKSIEHVIFLSATWLENKIAEAFVPLNILDPRHFPGRRSLLRYCLFDERGKSYSLNPRYRDTFLDVISNYVFRLTKEEAGLKFPTKYSYSADNRNAIWYDPAEFKSNTAMIHEYNQQLDLLELELRGSQPSYGTIIGFMSSLRHITGKMKVMNCAEYALLRLMELNEGEKLCIGVHHKSVMEWLKVLIESAGHKVLTMADESAEKKDEIETAWKDPNGPRVLIASVLGAGKGRNFQFCKNAILLERQWNKNKELQFEGRFHRIMVDENDKIRHKFTKADDVTIDYIMASGSFDEYFDDLVRLKGVIVDSADASVEEIPDSETIMELARRMITSRMKYVGQ